jgi:hypothetical protein
MVPSLQDGLFLGMRTMGYSRAYSTASPIAKIFCRGAATNKLE